MPLCRTVRKIGDERLAIEPPALLREFIQVFACADLYAAYLILLHM
jgi:hypothetical protein